ncbi:DNA polymerase III subunit delta [Candidatus Nomurabacteria bacterium]|nr:DNA polymerase III subunit delta [Candidatus Nomurabacteria bacterium]
MILFLYGQDTLRSRKRLSEMIAKFKEDRDPQSLNVVSLDCQKVKTEDTIWQQILSSPFLAEKRMVVLENLLVSSHKGLQKQLLERIEGQTLPESTVLVFWESTEKFKTKLAKEFFARLLKEKFVLHFENLEGAKLLVWVSEIFKENHLSIDKNALVFLCDNAGPDLWSIESVAAQLVSYKQDEGVVSLKDVQLFVKETYDDNIFNIIDNIVKKNTSNVFSQIAQIYRNGETPHYVHAMLVRQVRIMLMLKDAQKRGENLSDPRLAKKLSLHPFVVKKTTTVLQNYSLEKLQDLQNDLLDIDTQTKKGQNDPSLLLDVLVTKLANH